MAKKFLKSLSYATEGLGAAFATQRNFRLQLAIGALSIILAALLGFSRLEWIILLLAVCFILSVELVNTIVETIVDLVSPDINPRAKLAKNIGAGVVLINAIIIFGVGVLLFIPHLLRFLQL